MTAVLAESLKRIVYLLVIALVAFGIAATGSALVLLLVVQGP